MYRANSTTDPKVALSTAPTAKLLWAEMLKIKANFTNALNIHYILIIYKIGKIVRNS